MNYHSVLDDKRQTPAWIDDAIRKAVHPNPHKRYEALSEYIYDLRYPNKTFLNKSRPPHMERNPVAFWKSVCFIQTIIITVLLINRLGTYAN